jgi:WD40 repeat protein
MKAIGKLDHLNLVGAHDEDESPDGRVLYLAMELVDGSDVGVLVEERGPFPISEACEIARQAATGLAYVHQQGLVHRDIKPSNLMVASDGTVKILDLGLALLNDSQAGELTSNGQMMGTPDYMAPEQADNSHQVDHRADIYSLGCTLFKLLTGKAPFADPDCSTAAKKLRAHAEAPVPSLPDQRPDAPADLVVLLDRMLAKDPGDRFATADEVAEALRPFAEGLDLDALGITPAQANEASGRVAAARGSTYKPRSSPDVDTHASVASESPATAVTGAVPKRRLMPTRTTVIAVSAAFVLLAAMLVFRLMTDRGELVIECSDPGVKVAITRSGKTVRQMELQQGENGVTLWSGEYQIEVTSPINQMKIGNREVMLSRNGRVLVKVYRRRRVPVPLDIEPEPLDIAPGQPLTLMALVREPAAIDGGLSWTIETVQHRGKILDAAFSPDGERFATAGADGTIRIWDVETGKLRRVLVGHVSANLLAWSPNGHVIATHGADTIRVSDEPSGRLLRTIYPDSLKGLVHDLAWSPDAKTIAVGQGWLYGEQGSNISLYSVEDGRPFETIRVDDVRATVLAWSPDGKTLASGGDPPVVHLWDFEAADCIRRIEFDIKSSVINMEWSQDGSSLAVADFRDVEVRDTETGERVQWNVSEKKVEVFARVFRLQQRSQVCCLDRQPPVRPLFLLPPQHPAASRFGDAGGAL